MYNITFLVLESFVVARKSWLCLSVSPFTHRLISAAGAATISNALKATNSSLTYLDLSVCINSDMHAAIFSQAFGKLLSNSFGM